MGAKLKSLLYLMFAAKSSSRTNILVNFGKYRLELGQNLPKVGTELSSRDSSGGIEEFMNGVAAVVPIQRRKLKPPSGRWSRWASSFPYQYNPVFELFSLLHFLLLFAFPLSLQTFFFSFHLSSVGYCHI